MIFIMLNPGFFNNYYIYIYNSSYTYIITINIPCSLPILYQYYTNIPWLNTSYMCYVLTMAPLCPLQFNPKRSQITRRLCFGHVEPLKKKRDTWFKPLVYPCYTFLIILILSLSGIQVKATILLD